MLIREDIKEYYEKQLCVVCGSGINIECCHKNDLYNDNRVLNIETQTLDDFHSLCVNHKIEKHKITQQTIKTNKRFSAKNIPSLKIFNIDFITGDEIFDKNNPNALVGTYWYDPVEFLKKIKLTITI